MKKILLAVICAAMVLSLAGCDNQGASSGAMSVAAKNSNTDNGNSAINSTDGFDTLSSAVSGITDADSLESDNSKQEAERRRSEDEKSIRECVDSGGYTNAYAMLNQYVSEYGEDETAVKIGADLKQRVMSQITEQVNKYTASLDFLKAREYVGGKKADFTDYTELSDLYNELTSSYVDNVIDNAKSNAEWGDFETAYEIIKIGISNIGNNDRLIYFRSELKKYEPVYLVDIEPFSTEGPKPSVYVNEKLFKSKINYTLQSFSDSAKDNTGTDHFFSYFIGRNQKSAQSECSATYLLNGQYDTFSGIGGFPHYNSISPNPAYFEIYGDGELLYSSPFFDKDVLPVDFSVDISGVSLMKIEFHNDGSIFSNNEGAKIYDAVFAKTIDFD
ncbi:MAG: NPCBM/NEW2 domain-containing protein [Lachnospiraceae bacterium]|nr:NPCBM/NEW2 domain-containing protein [Ruminococcus sp.]MCM1275548.1 NPCBM/NEW2 domain-containing protein [Lachnospiraceae bacterium]